MKYLPLTSKIRDEFPILKRKINGYPLSFLDNSSTTQKPYSVIEALVNFYTNHNSNVSRGVYKLAEEATEIFESGRDHVAKFIGADSADEVIFTSGTTESINLVANGWLKNKLIVGSQIIVTEMEHHSNLVPWQLVAQSTGAELFYWKKNKEGRLDLEDLKKLINVSVKVIAITAVSNVLGTINLIKKIIEIAHLNNIPVLVDAAQALARIPVNVKEWDCDFLAFSGHKVYGPNGIGVLYSKKERIDEMLPIKGGGGMISYVEKQKSNWARAPQKFEAGTPAVAEVYSLTKALEFIELYGISQIQKHEQELTSYVLKRFSEMEDLILYGPKDTLDRVGIISFNFCNLHAHDVAQVLDEYGIAVRAGHHCTHILHKTLGIVASVRISFGIYNEKSEIDRLLDALKKTREIFFITRKK